MEFKNNLEVKVGLFIFVGLAVLTILVVSVKEFYFLTPRYNVRAIFNFANGVEVGSLVRFAGVEVGEIKNIRLLCDEKLGKTDVEVLILLKGGIKIPYDSKVHINVLGLFGEKYLEITPGEDYTRFLKNNDTIIGSNPVSIGEVTQKSYEVGLKLEETVENLNIILNKVKNGEGSLGKLVSDDGFYNDLEELLEDIKANPWKLLHKAREKKPSKSRDKR